MEQIISKEELGDLMRIEGKVKGDGMKSWAEFIVKEEGEEGLKKLEDTITTLGYPIKYREIKAMLFYPVGLEAATLVAIKRLFHYDDSKFQEMGKFGVKFSIIVRIFMKYFVAPEKLLKKASAMWGRGTTIGNLVVAEYNKEKKYLILRLENHKVHPIHCQVFKGSIHNALQMILKSEVTCQETKCPFRGDNYHEFLLKW